MMNSAKKEMKVGKAPKATEEQSSVAVRPPSDCEMLKPEVSTNENKEIDLTNLEKWLDAPLTAPIPKIKSKPKRKGPYDVPNPKRPTSLSGEWAHFHRCDGCDETMTHESNGKATLTTFNQVPHTVFMRMDSFFVETETSEFLNSTEAFGKIPVEWAKMMTGHNTIDCEHGVCTFFASQLRILIPLFEMSARMAKTDDERKTLVSELVAQPFGWFALRAPQHFLCVPLLAKINDRVFHLRAMLRGQLLAEAPIDNENIAPEIDIEPEGIIEKCKNFFRKYVAAPLKALKSFGKWFVGTILDPLFSFFSFGAGFFTNLLKDIKAKMLEYFDLLFSPLKDLATTTLNYISAKVGMVVSAIVLLLLGWGSMKFLSWVIDYATGVRVSTNININLSPDMMKAEGGIEIWSTVIAGMLSLFSITKGGDAIVIWAKRVTALFAGTMLMTKFAAMLFTLLPITIQNCVRVKLGGERAAASLRFEQWRDEVTMLVAVSKNARVVASEVYKVRVQQAMDECYGFLGEISTDERAVYVQLFSRLLAVYQLTTSNADSNKKRPYPYVLHLSGAPGLGKSTIIESIIRNLGFSAGNAFFRDLSSEYWNGFLPNMKVVVYDEFLVSSDMDVGPEFLQLVSSLPFAPNMASVDNMSVGIKGTYAAPDLIVTCCNTAYPTSKSVNTDALHRRRRKVVEFQIADDYASQFKDNRIDLAQFSPEQLKGFVWLKFRYVGTHNRPHGAASNWMTASELFADLKNDFKTFMSVSRSIASELDSNSDALTVEEIMAKYLRASTPFGAMEGKSIFELLSDCVQSIYPFHAERGGKKERKRKENRAARQAETTSSAPETRDEQQSSDESASNSDEHQSESDTFETAERASETNDEMPDPLSYRSDPREIYEPFRIALDPSFDWTIEGVVKSGDNTKEWTDLSIKGVARAPHHCEESLLQHWWRKDPGVILGGVAGLIVAASYLLGDYLAGRKTNMDEVMVGEGQFSGKKAQGPQAQRRKRGQVLRGEASRDLTSAIVKLGWASTGSEVHGLMIGGTRILTVAHHFLDERGNLKSGDMYVIAQGKRYTTPFQLACYSSVEECDVAVYDFTLIPQLQPARDIRSRFAHDSELDLLTFCDLCIHNPAEGRTVVRGKSSSVTYASGNMRFEMTGLRYVFYGQPGYCGMPLTAVNGNLVGKILGIHVASNGNPNSPVAAATFVSFELLNELLGTKELPDMDDELTAQAGEDCDISHSKTCVKQHLEDTIRHKQYVNNVYGYVRPSLRKLTPGQVSAHDDSKFMDDEIQGYCDRFNHQEDTPRWKEALNHHYCNNPHHPEFYKGEPMPTADLEESIVDMMARDWEKQGPPAIKMSDLASRIEDKFLERYCEADRTTVRKVLDRIAANDPGEVRMMIPQAAPTKGLVVDIEMVRPNLKKAERISRNQVVHITQESKLKASAIAPFLPWAPKKATPLLHPSDPRTRGRDPIGRGIERMWDKEKPRIDPAEAKAVAEDMLHFYEQSLQWPMPPRELTFEEAVMGVPGVLKSMDLNTSPGWPLVKTQRGKGKREFVNIVVQPGETAPSLVVAPGFKEQVLLWKKRFEEGCELEPHIWLGFLKDELMSASKIEDCRTRIIYCGDLISNIVFRMKFGALVAAFNASCRETPFGMGLNQYSWDMNVIKEYLDEVDGPGYIAGDCKDFDISTQVDVHYETYHTVLGGLMRKFFNTPEAQIERFWEHQNMSPAQLGDIRFEAVTAHFSGCFFTTPVNCLNHEAYWRIAFRRRCPGLNPREHMRMKFLGDDNIIRLSHQAAKTFNAVIYAEEAAKMGITYTSDVKGAPLTADFRAFDEITFLGAHPRIVAGNWSGALKKETLFETMLWTRDNNESLAMTAYQMVELASQWDQKFYEEYLQTLNNAFEQAGLEPIPHTSAWGMARRMTAERTTSSGLSYLYAMFANMGDPLRDMELFEPESGKEILQAESGRPTFGSTMENTMAMTEHEMEAGQLIEAPPNLTVLQSPTANCFTGTERHFSTMHEASLGEPPYGAEFAAQSLVYRTAIAWSKSDEAGKVIKAIPVPFGLLQLGSQETMQNRMFQSFIYWRGEVLVALQLNGTKFQQGILAAYYRPLTVNAGAFSTCLHHLSRKMGPSSGMTYLLRIPFRHPRKYLNTFASQEVDESLGTLFLRVLSPLRAVEEGDITVSLYAGFPNTEFRLPRPIGQAARRRGKLYFEPSEDGTEIEILQAEGGAQSTQGSTTVNNIYNIGDVAGGMTLENPTSTGSHTQGATTDVTTDIEMPMPMDKPALLSGGVPTRNTYHGMSRSNGVEYSVALQLNPTALARTHLSDFNDDKDYTMFETLMALWSIITTVKLTVQNPAGHLLWSRNVCGAFDGWEYPNNAELKQFPYFLQSKIQDMFWFWSGDVEFAFTVSKTFLHNFRLRFVMAYGADRPATFAESTVYKNLIMDFTEGNNRCTVRVPYNAATAFLRSPAGEIADPIQTYSLGWAGLFVVNPLNAPTTVVQEVDILVEMRMVNTRLAVPRAFGYVNDWNPTGNSDAVFRIENEPPPSLPEPELDCSMKFDDLWPDDQAHANTIVRMLNPGWRITYGTPIVKNCPSAHLFFQDEESPSIVVPLASLRHAKDAVNMLKIIERDMAEVEKNCETTKKVTWKEPLRAEAGAGTLGAQVTPVAAAPLPLGAQVAPAPRTAQTIAVTEEPPSEVESEPQIIPIAEGPSTEVNRPAKLDVGAHFEYCPRGILEVYRRHHMVEEGRGGLAIAAPLNTVYDTEWNIFNKPLAHIFSLYSGWKGSLKYRFIVNTPADAPLPLVVYQPDLSSGLCPTDVLLTGQAFGEPIDIVYQKKKINCSKYPIPRSPLAENIAAEVFHRDGNTVVMDFTIPFQNHQNFLLAGQHTGLIRIFGKGMTVPQCYQALGDDFFVGAYRGMEAELYARAPVLNSTGKTVAFMGFDIPPLP